MTRYILREDIFRRSLGVSEYRIKTERDGPLQSCVNIKNSLR